MSEEHLSSDEPTFTGFTKPITNYFRMPNEWIDICAQIESLAELKVVQYVLRHTWGFQEFDGPPKVITTDEFMHGRKRKDGTRLDQGTGLSNKSVIDGLRRAVKHGYLSCDIDDTDKARVIKAYKLTMEHPSDSGVKNLHTGRCEESTQPGCEESTHLDVKILHTDCEESTHRSEKDTLERHQKKNTRERKPKRATVNDSPTGKAHTQECSSSSPPSREDGTSLDSSEIERIYTIFDRLGQEIVKDPTFHYPREEKVTTAIAKWLQARSVPYDEGRLQEIYQKLWNSPPDRRTGFDWQENMSIPAVLGQYDRLSLALVARARRNQREQTYQMTGYSRPVEEPAEELPFVGVSKLRTLSTGKEKRR